MNTQRSIIWLLSCLLAPGLALQALAGEEHLFAGKLGRELPQCAESAHSGRWDMDQDGKKDCYRACYHGGSGFGGKRLFIQANCSGPEICLDVLGSFAHFVNLVELPPALAKRPALLRGAIELLFGAPSLRAGADSNSLEPPPMDGSFRWLLDWYTRPPLSQPGPFAQLRSYQTIWSNSEVGLPPSQVSILHHPLDKTGGDKTRKTKAPVLAAYYAHNHGQLRKGAGCGSWQLWTSHHGVAIEDKKSGRLSWAFVSSGQGLAKLRWPSLVKAYCADGLVFVERKLHQGQRRQWWVVHPAGGRLGLLPQGSKLDADKRVHLTSGQSLDRSQIKAALSAAKDWAQKYDLDGDGLPDRVTSHFSGGAHCCYSISVFLSLTKKEHRFPFQLDGGYMGGLDLSQPRRFNLVDLNGDGLPELFMEIATYNGQPQTIPSEWTKKHGVTSNHISISFKDGLVKITNY